jgi:hypothetical protein
MCAEPVKAGTMFSHYLKKMCAELIAGLRSKRMAKVRTRCTTMAAFRSKGLGDESKSLDEVHVGYCFALPNHVWNTRFDLLTERFTFM